MIVYKVVEKKTRNCSNIAMCKQSEVLYFTGYTIRELLSNKKTKEFFPIYKKGKTIKAVKGSIGIMCFETIEAAKTFKKDAFKFPSAMTIIQVEGLGKPRKRLKIICSCGCNPTHLFDPQKEQLKADPPAGTITFNSVKVLE